MRFDYTTRSLFPSVAQRAVPSDDAVAALLIAYEHQQSQEVSAPDHALLDQALLLFEARPREQDLDATTMYLAEALYSHRAERETLLALLTEYVADARPADEEGWARWHVVDNFALLRRCAEVVTVQRRLAQWAEGTCGVASCLWTMTDSFHDVADDSDFENATVVLDSSSTADVALGRAGRDTPRAEPAH